MGLLRSAAVSFSLLCTGAGCALYFLPNPSVYEVEAAIGCEGVLAGGNVFVPYGVEVTDCERASAIFQGLADRRAKISVYAGNCVLRGKGDKAAFVGACDREQLDDEEAIPEVVAEGLVPLRDGEGRILANIDVKGHNGELLYRTLARAQAVTLGEVCKGDYRRYRRHYCEALRDALCYGVKGCQRF